MLFSAHTAQLLTVQFLVLFPFEQVYPVSHSELEQELEPACDQLPSAQYKQSETFAKLAFAEKVPSGHSSLPVFKLLPSGQ